MVVPFASPMRKAVAVKESKRKSRGLQPGVSHILISKFAS